jgi:hypothetical protein
MSKRLSDQVSPAAKKKPCSSKGTTQSTLHMFFKSHDSGGEKPIAKPKTIEYSPEFFGIHTYSEEDIRNSIGLDKTYKQFWNAKALELSKDEKARRKLKDKAGIQGAINTIWTLHKSDLLKIQVEELTVYVSQAYNRDKIAMINYLSSVEANKEKVMELTESLRLLYEDATDEAGPEVSDIMKELRKVQGALKKTIDRKQQELQFPHNQILIALPSETLSSLELQDIVTDIKETEHDTQFDPKIDKETEIDPEVEEAEIDAEFDLKLDEETEIDTEFHLKLDAETEIDAQYDPDIISLSPCSVGSMIIQNRDRENDSVVSESPISSRSGSPVFPILSGLDTYKSVQ